MEFQAMAKLGTQPLFYTQGVETQMPRFDLEMFQGLGSNPGFQSIELFGKHSSRRFTAAMIGRHVAAIKDAIGCASYLYVCL